MSDIRPGIHRQLRRLQNELDEWKERFDFETRMVVMYRSNLAVERQREAELQVQRLTGHLQAVRDALNSINMLEQQGRGIE